MKTIIIGILMILSLKASAQCESNATKQETLEFIKKVISTNAHGSVSEMYSEYRIGIFEEEKPRLVIVGSGITPAGRILGLKENEAIFVAKFEAQINDLSGTVNIRKFSNHIQLEITTEDGSEKISRLIANLKGNETKETVNKMYILLKNDEELARRLKKAFEHLLCLFNRKKDKF